MLARRRAENYTFAMAAPPPADERPAAVPLVPFPPRDPQGRDNHFNFLRLVLASLVILSHAPELLDGSRRRELLSRLDGGTLSFGELAVDGFFLLSGFLIVQSWERQPRLGPYLRKRALRIYPGFVVAALVSAFVVGPLAADARAYFAQFRPGAFLGGVLLLQRPAVPPVFAGLAYPEVNNALWTIAYEFGCYLFVAAMGTLGFVKNRRGWLLVALAVLAYSSLPGHVTLGLPGGGTWEVALRGAQGSACRLLAFFSVGGCFYLFRGEVRYRAGWAAVAAVVAAAGLGHARSVQGAVGIAGGYLLFWFAFRRVRSLEFFQRHADVSYGVYLYGWPAISLLVWWRPGISPWTLFAAAWAASLVLGWMSWHAVELPFLRLKPRHDPRDASPA